MKTSELAAKDIHAYLEQHENKDLLRFLTCGSVDDGKSTLIGRLLYDSKMIYEDQLAAVMKDSKIHGTTGDDFDPALLTDGLKAEREQGITIDVAYRYFATPKRKFIIADTPGHVQYTRNMVTGASNCDLAIILVDARHGISEQTRRHAFLVSLLGIRHVVFAVNKMDLVDWSEEVFEKIRADGEDMAARLESRDVEFVPVSALRGDNVVFKSDSMPWYQGKPILDHLETVHVASDRNFIDLRLYVQYVARLDGGVRGYCGTIASGVLRAGQEVVALPSGRRSKVASILVGGEPVEEAVPPMAVMVTLEDQVDVSRGDCLSLPGNVPRLTHEVEAMVVWMHESPGKEKNTYLIKHTTQSVPAALSKIRYKVDVNTMRKNENESAEPIQLNEIARVHLTLHRPVLFDPYRKNSSTGSFVIIDRMTNATVGAGMILDRATSARKGSDAEPVSQNIRKETGLVTRGRTRATARTAGDHDLDDRAERLRKVDHRSGSGKTPH
jgi:bifunctional enzyme CysN/CysC